METCGYGEVDPRFGHVLIGPTGSRTGLSGCLGQVTPKKTWTEGEGELKPKKATVGFGCGCLLLQLWRTVFSVQA